MGTPLAAVLVLLLCAAALPAQEPRLFVAFTWNIGADTSLPENRAMLAVRWHPCVGPICAQVGGTLIRDDIGRIARPFRQLSHFGFGADVGSRRWRLGGSLTQFDQHTGENQRRYYRALALSMEYRGAVNVLVERQAVQWDVADVGTPIHALRALIGWRVVTMDVQHTTSRNVPQPYDHWTWTFTAAARPFLVRLGTQSVSVAGPDANRNRPVAVAQIGLWWGLR